MANKRSIEKLVGTALLAAIVAVLQLFVVVPLGAYNITLTLIPIVIGAILYGPSAGAFLGGVFGAIVSFQVVTGAAGAMSSQMFQMAPVVTIAICMLKGIAAGLVAGLLYRAFANKQNTVGVITAAVACPLVNTGIFIAALFVFYYDLIVAYAADNAYADAFAFVFIGVVGINFVVEFVINVLLIPIVLRLIRIIKPQKKA